MPFRMKFFPKLEFIQNYASKGNPKALALLAYSHLYAVGVMPNISEALIHARRAAATKLPFGDYVLGVCLHSILQIDQAHIYFRRSATHNEQLSFIYLGFYFSYVMSDLSLSVSFCQQAGRRGYGPAYQILSHLYRNGVNGFDQKYVQV